MNSKSSDSGNIKPHSQQSFYTLFFLDAVPKEPWQLTNWITDEVISD